MAYLAGNEVDYYPMEKMANLAAIGEPHTFRVGRLQIFKKRDFLGRLESVQKRVNG